MSTQDPIPLEYRDANGPRVLTPPPVMSWIHRAAYLVGGILAPILFILGACFFEETFGRTSAWQDGTFAQKASMLWTAKALLPFLPFWLYALACLLSVVIAPARCRDWFPVRCGIYTGLLLCLQTAALLVLPLGSSGSPLVALLIFALCFVLPIAVLLALIWAISWAIRRWGPLWTITLLLCILGTLPLTAVIIWIANSSGHPMGSAPSAAGPIGLLAFVIVLLTLGPGAMLSAYGILAFWVWRTHQRRLLWRQRTVALILWPAAYALAWRAAVRAALAAYAELPKSPPHCYIATAAARGHPNFVGVDRTLAFGAVQVPINAQLRRLKAAEIALQILAPSLHHFCRRLYNRWGPLAARALCTKPLADLAYLSLKPAEYIARFALRLLLGPQAHIHTARFYRAPPNF